MFKKKIEAVVIILFMMIMGSNAWAQETGTLIVRVIPAESTVMLIKGDNIVEQWSGRKRIDELAPGKYILRSGSIGYQPHQEEVEVVAGEKLRVKIRLKEMAAVPLTPSSNPSQPDDGVFVVVDTPPTLIGGMAELQKRINYPEEAKAAGVEGRVFVQFIVDENGNATDAEVVKGLGSGCDEEAIRVVNVAKFKPAKKDGKAVKVRYSLPVVFEL